MKPLGYVVIEWNQASGQPSIAYNAPDMYDDREDAEQVANRLRTDTARIGRRERYTVAEVIPLEDE
jgi:hypothetical protein